MIDETYTSASVADTEAIGADLGRRLSEEAFRRSLMGSDGNCFIGFYGDLGAGKTAFIRGLASVIAPDAPVSSPTFAIMNQYVGDSLTLCHFDMYRITSDDDLYSVGFYDLEGVIIAAEWCENIPYALPNRYLTVTIRRDEASAGAENEGRRIEIRQIEKDV